MGVKMKDYIYIYNENGEKIKMEAVIALKLNNSDDQYIAYRDENRPNVIYIAKIKPNTNELDTNLSNKEKEMLKEIIQKQIKE